MNTHIGYRIFQDTLRRVAKFRENRPMDVKRLWWDKQITRQNITVFAYRYSDTRATVKNHSVLVGLGFSRAMCTRMIPEASAATGFSVGLHWR